MLFDLIFLYVCSEEVRRAAYLGTYTTTVCLCSFWLIKRSTIRDLHRRSVECYASVGTCADAAKVVGTGLIGWLLNIVLVLCSGPM